MMKLLLAVAALVAVALASDASTTLKPLDGHNQESISSILTDKEKLGGYIKCVLNQGPCNPSSERLKAITQNALGDECSKCEPKQKELLAHMAAYVAEKMPTEWEQMKDQFDPKKEHRKSIDDLVALGKTLAAAGTTPQPTTPKKA